MEAFISRLMRASVLVSGVIILAGFSVYLVTGNDSCPVNMFDPTWMLFGAPFFAPSHIIFWGFMVLIGTPLLRIMLSVAVYAKMKDWEFTVITGIVFTILLVSMVLGIG
jgi:uncharacterized membrane protein